jgi:hypothetical protein
MVRFFCGAILTLFWIVTLAIVCVFDAYSYRKRDLGLGMVWGIIAGILWGAVIGVGFFLLALAEAEASGFVSLPQVPDITIEVVIAMAGAGLLGITLGVGRNVSVGVPWPRTNTFQISERVASVAYFRVLPSKVSPQEPPHGFHDTRD